MYTLNALLGGKRCLVVGGGEVATRKVGNLIESGAHVTVTAPDFSVELLELGRQDKVELVERPFEPVDVEGMSLIFAATDDPATNAEVAAAARGAGAWVNVADAPELGDFFVPASVKRGAVEVSVSTAGASPALAAWLRDLVGKALPKGVEELAELCRELRAKGAGPPDREGWKNLFNSGILTNFARGDREGVAFKLEVTLGRRAVEVYLAMKREQG